MFGVLSAGNVLLDLAITVVTGLAGVLLALFLRRRTTLSVRNLYLPAAVGLLAFAAAAIADAWKVEMIVLPLAAPWVAGGRARQGPPGAARLPRAPLSAAVRSGGAARRSSSPAEPSWRAARRPDTPIRALTNEWDDPLTSRGNPTDI